MVYKFLSEAESLDFCGSCLSRKQSRRGIRTLVRFFFRNHNRNGHVAKSEDLHGDRTHYELRRQYHCHAYNMLVAVISCTQTKPQFYQGFLFKEDLTKGQYLFDNLIDAEKEYRFEVELEVRLTSVIRYVLYSRTFFARVRLTKCYTICIV